MYLYCINDLPFLLLTFLWIFLDFYFKDLTLYSLTGLHAFLYKYVSFGIVWFKLSYAHSIIEIVWFLVFVLSLLIFLPRFIVRSHVLVIFTCLFMSIVSRKNLNDLLIYDNKMLVQIPLWIFYYLDLSVSCYVILSFMWFLAYNNTQTDVLGENWKFPE